MHPLWILLVGVLIVVGGILVFRLHAFLALILAALVVGGLTPITAIEQSLAQKAALVPLESAAGRARFVIPQAEGAIAGTQYLVVRADPTSRQWDVVERLELVQLTDETSDQGDRRTVAEARATGDPAFELKASDLVVHPRAWQAAQSTAKKTIGERVALAFGSTCGKIGILIAMAAIIGKCLLDSGAADRIVRSALKRCGERGAPVAFVLSGFLLGIPVFFDTVFYLMIPLGKALAMRTTRNYLLYILTIVAGATMAHSLVPPTPGPLLVAGELAVDLGTMIIAGCLVGLVASSTAMVYAHFMNRRFVVPLRESSDFSLDELKKLSEQQDDQLPPLSLALLPILLPVVLIAGHTFLKSFGVLPGDHPLMAVAATLGNKNIALGIAAALALGMLAWKKRVGRDALAKSVADALASGGVIILITAGGGAFGAMLQQTGVVELIGRFQSGSSTFILCLAFLITAGVRTAQGSATVAMITAVGILAGLAGQLDCHPVYLALAIGCGSKPVAWMNDSGFWVICKMSGMTEAEGLRYVTPMSILMGLSGLAATLVGSLVWPMK